MVETVMSAAHNEIMNIEENKQIMSALLMKCLMADSYNGIKWRENM